MAIRVRKMTTEEAEAIERLASSRTQSAGLVERAKIVWLSQQGEWVKGIAQTLGIHGETVRTWLKRFNSQGLAG